MEKRILGILLSVLGIAGLVIAAVMFVNGVKGSQSVRQVVIYAVLGAIFFFSGIGLVRNTRDRPS